jgi:[acyl-carrier-protein] S-malonyltransferase
VHWDSEEIKKTLVKQVTNPVQWEQSMNQVLKSSDFQKAYEIGPGSVCRGILKKINRRAKTLGVEV